MRKFLSIIKQVGAILSFTALMMTVPSCQQEELADPMFSIEGEASSYNVPYDGNTASTATRFTIRSNQNWEIVPVEEYDWVRPFPDRGEDDGYFTFLVEENFSASVREAYFKMLVDGVEQPALFTVTQETRGEYVALKETSFVVTYEESTLEIAMETNVELELVCTSDDSGLDGAWLTMAPEAEQIEGTLVLKVAESTLPSPRNGVFLVQKKGDSEVAQEISVMQTGTQELYGLPAVWKFNGRQDEPGYKESFEENNKVEVANKDENGLGYLSYVEGVDSGKPDNGKFNRIIGGTGDPYVEGAWPGDYWLFEVPAVVPANTVFNISFVTRVSGTGHKFWMLEYLDGNEWLPAGEVKTTNEPGSEIEYTTALITNEYITVNTNFKVVNPATSLQVRFRCAANWQSNGEGALSAPNTGTSRISGKDDAIAQISVVATGVGGEAEINTPDLEGDFIVLEGSGDPVSFTVNATENWTLAADENPGWLRFSPDSGNAGEDVTVSVSADPNETGATRRAVLTVTAGMSTKSITVIQGAAGAVLEPLISIVGGNSGSVPSKEDKLSIKLQANVDVSVDENSLPDWIEYTPAANTKAMVDVLTFDFTVLANKSADNRSGKIRFYNEEYNLETVYTVNQSYFAWFEENFEWLDPWSQAGDNKGKPAGQTVETDDLDAYCPQLPTPKAEGVSALEALEEKGYQMVRVGADGKEEAECIYLQRNYLKFGKTSYQAGIVLPSIDGIPTGEALNINFDWCPMKQGSSNDFKIDPVNLIVEVTNGDDVKTFEVPTHGWENGHVLEWIHASVALTGATVTADTKITIKQQEWGVKTANRWFLDNIKIVSAE